MIIEDYCSFEVAKLLKEKEFDERTLSYYYENAVLCHGDWFEWNRSPLGHIAAPTHQMAMAWLRKVHNICIVVYPFTHLERGSYTSDVCTTTMTMEEGHLRCVWNTYEEAVEESIKYCLENLI